MSDKKNTDPSESSGDRQAERGHDQDSYGGSLATRQMRPVGNRRRDAEEKLEHHLPGYPHGIIHCVFRRVLTR
jgi:hypothetical protein